MSDAAGASMIRMIENDRGIAQCDIRPAGAMAAGTQLTMQALIADAVACGATVLAGGKPIDGAGYFQMLTRIFIPVALPGIIAATIFAFTVSWAQFLYPLAFTTSTDQLVLPVGIITTLIKGDVFNWGPIMAASVAMSIPVVAF